MSEIKFLELLRNFRFDNRADLSERQKNHKLRAMSSSFEGLISYSQKLYQVGPCVTTEDMLF